MAALCLLALPLCARLRLPGTRCDTSSPVRWPLRVHSGFSLSLDGWTGLRRFNHHHDELLLAQRLDYHRRKAERPG